LPTVANAGADVVTELSNVQLNANVPAVGNGGWTIVSGEGNFSSANDPVASISGLQNGETILIWTISNGTCPSSTDTIKIYRNELYIPQVITPNGDGLNDVFEIKAYKGFSGPKFELFNRWGTLVYSTTNYQNNFDGTNPDGIVLAEDTYYYVIETSDDKTYKGFLIIKRK
jgi:gliding motility-associated-like protein